MSISKIEFSKVRRALANDGVPLRVRNKVALNFGGDLDEKRPRAGVDRDELKRGMKRLNEKKHAYGLSDNQLAKVEKAMKKRV